jgi:hypothetical protein
MKASRASYCPRYQSRSELNWVRRSYFTCARPCSSCEGQSIAREEESGHETFKQEKDEEQASSQAKNTYFKELE